jgi:hypothetical protein
MPDGSTITVAADGTISSAAAYTLPPATTSTLGGVIVGNNLTVDANGTLDATDTTYTAGTNVQISAGNVISATDTTYTAGTNVQISAGNVISATDTTYTAGTNVQISAGNVISATDTTYLTMTGATSSAAGASGLVPAPAAGDNTKYLKGDGTWGTISQYTPTVFYVDKWLPRYGSTPYVDDVHVYKDSALTETATLQELYDAMDAGNTALVYDAAMNGAKVYTTLYAFHSPHNGNPDSIGDYLYFAGDDGTVIGANPHGFSTNDAAVFNTSVYGLYSVNVMSGATSSVTGSAGLVPAPTTSDPDKYLKGDGTWANLPSANNISSTDWNALWQ